MTAKDYPVYDFLTASKVERPLSAALKVWLEKFAKMFGDRWKELAEIGGGDPVFEEFLKAGNANVLVPINPGYERPVIFFLKTGLLWFGDYMPLFTDDDMLEVYSDVELARELDPPEQIGESWDIRLPTSLIMLQEDSELPKFPVEEETPEPLTVGVLPAPDESVPF